MNVDAPYANDKYQEDFHTVDRLKLERDLMHFHVEKESLEGEYSKLEQAGGRTMKARKRICSIEARLRTLSMEINALKRKIKSA